MTFNTTKLAVLGAALIALGTLASSSLTAATRAGDLAPVFTEPSPCNEIFVCTPGVQTCITIQAVSPTQNALLLNWNNIPIGGTTNPILPILTAPGQPAVTQFCWTPGPADVGQTYMAIFTAFNESLTGLNTKCDVFFKCETALSAEIGEFGAKVKFPGGPMLVTWDTVAEIDHAYFNVYRSKGTLAESVMINKTPIIALGSPISGASYSLLDRTVKTGGVYKYWLEAVDIYGQTQTFGPVHVYAR